MLTEGDRIDIWVVEAALGHGGMGSVYRCHNEQARRILAAVKVLDASLGRHPKARARFIRKAEILFELDHPCIVKVRNVRIDSSPPYLEMELVDGRSLERLVDDTGPRSVADVAKWLGQLADALDHMHKRGVRHRDIKPSNLLVRPSGDITLVDFGIATEADGDTLTERGAALGSVCYVPPEWARPGELDPVRWDIYALGVSMVEALTGKVGFRIPTEGVAQTRYLQVLTAKQGHPPLDPGPQFPVALRALLCDMTRSDWHARIGTASELAARVRGLDLTRVDPAVTFSDLPLHRQPVRTQMDPRGTIVVPADATVTPDTFAADPAPPRRPAWGWALGAGLGTALLVGAWGTWSWPTERTVHATLPAGVNATVTLDGAAPAADGTWARVALGAHTVAADVGTDCVSGAAWCAHVEQAVTVVRGGGVQELALALEAPTPRAVTVTTPAGMFHLDAGPAGTGTGAPVMLSAPPGRYPARAWAGTCPDPGCGGVDCPAGCSGWTGELIVPWGQGPVSVAIALPAPVSPAPVVPAPPAPSAQPAHPVAGAPSGAAPASAPAATGNAGALVSNSQLAAWLGSHPDWVPDAAQAAGKADARYLAGWTGSTPPAGKEKSFATNLVAAVAEGYCAGHGGLAPVDAAPTSWTYGGGQPWLEYRADGGHTVLLRNDGTRLGQFDGKKAATAVGFRCRR